MPPIPPATEEAGGGPIGRPSSLTSEVRDRFRTALLNLNSVEDSARFAGIGERTVWRWLARGRDPKGPEDADYRQFWQEVESWKAEAKVLLVGRAYAHTKTNPRSAFEMLARRYPAEWGRKDGAAPPPPPGGGLPDEDPRVALARRLVEVRARIEAVTNHPTDPAAAVEPDFESPAVETVADPVADSHGSLEQLTRLLNASL